MPETRTHAEQGSRSAGVRAMQGVPAVTWRAYVPAGATRNPQDERRDERSSDSLPKIASADGFRARWKKTTDGASAGGVMDPNPTWARPDDRIP